MATCPRCKGHLTDSHKCPRRPLVVAAEIIASALAGGFIGLLLVAIFDHTGQIPDTDYFISVIAGAGIAIALHRAVRNPQIRGRRFAVRCSRWKLFYISPSPLQRSRFRL